MRPGALVMRRNSWSIHNTGMLGIVVDRSSEHEGAWLVLWTGRGSYSLQEHMEDALHRLDDCDQEA
jgi:hypothetical protein